MKAKSFLALLIVLICNTSMAKERGPSSSGGSPHQVSAALGFVSTGVSSIVGEDAGSKKMNSTVSSPSGLFGLGLDYIYSFSRELGVGAFFRYYSVSEEFTPTGGTSTALDFGLLTFGALARATLPFQSIAFYVNFGMGMLKPYFKTKEGTATKDYTTTMSMGYLSGYGVTYKINSSISAGLEHNSFYFLGADNNGNPVTDWMLKLQMSMGGLSFE